MRITAVRAVALSASWEQVFGGAENVPPHLWRPAAHFSTFPRRGQCAVLVTVQTDEGIAGMGEAWGLPLPAPAALLVQNYLGPALIGKTINGAQDIAAFWDSVYQMAESLGYTRGLWMEALSGLDLALWDCLAKREGVSVSRLGGITEVRPVPVYASPVPLLPSPEASAAYVRGLLSPGIGGVKIKAGRASVEEDICHAAAVREAIGPAPTLFVDFNCRGTAESVLRFARETADLNLAWIEEPLPPEATDEMTALRRRLTTPVAAGENEFAPAGFRALAGAGVDVLTPNITRAGGFTGLLRIADALPAARLSLHGVGGAVMLAASLQAAQVIAMCEGMERNTLPNPLRDDLGLHRPQMQGEGLLPLPGPGWGVELNHAVSERYSG